MSKKTLKFTVSQLIINSSRFDLSTFSDLKDADLDTYKVVHKEGEKEEILSITKFTKAIEDERFITIYFNEGNKFPYTDKVIDSNLEEHANPSPTFLVTRANRDSIVVRHWNVQSRISRKSLLLRVSAALS